MTCDALLLLLKISVWIKLWRDPSCNTNNLKGFDMTTNIHFFSLLNAPCLAT